MYGELVKTLLQKHFGEPKNSLMIGDSTEPENKVYFYSLENEEKIAAIRDLLNMKDLVSGIDRIPELRQWIPDRGEELTETPQCALFRETEEGWEIWFSRIEGVNYHRLRGNKVVAALQMEQYPFVVLSERETDFYGFWRKLHSKKRTPQAREGLSYWMNKALKTNKRFRAFAVDFFLAVGEAEHLYILKDVARTIQRCGCFILPISYRDLIAFRTPAALIRSFQREQTDIQVDFNKVDINVGYVMAMLAPAVDRRDWKRLSRFDAATVSEVVSLKILYDGFSPDEFIRWYYRKRLEELLSDFEAKTYAEDYVTMCLEADEPFRLCYDTDSFIRAHDELSYRNRLRANEEELKKPLLKTPSRFDKLEDAIRQTGTTELERICTARRLMDEGEYQHNCVFSRRDLVRRDRAAIYRWNHEGESYTVQFRRDTKGGYAVEEIRARFNRSVTEKHLDDLKQLLAGICTVEVSAGAPRPQAEPAEFDRWELELDMLPF